MSRAMMIYFVAYLIANFAAIMLTAAIVNGIRYDAIKLFFFSILITVFQFVLEHFFKLDIILTIFCYPIIYMALTGFIYFPNKTITTHSITTLLNSFNTFIL